VASPGSAYSTEASLVNAACGDVTHLRALPDSGSRVAQFALPIPAFGCHGFSPWQLRTRSFGAAREVVLPLPRGLRPDSLTVAADPLRPSAEGAAPYGKTSDALFVTRRCYRESSNSRVRRRPSPTFAALGPLPAGSRIPFVAVGLARRRSRPRTPSIGSMLDLAIEWSDLRDPCHVRAHSPRTLSPDTTKPASSRTELPCRATSRRRSRPLTVDSRGREEDASRRLLQLTYNTCTRGPFGSRA
jgi:hypothetical protein